MLVNILVIGPEKSDKFAPRISIVWCFQCLLSLRALTGAEEHGLLATEMANWLYQLLRAICSTKYAYNHSLITLLKLHVPENPCILTRCSLLHH